jgi:phosphomannomutase
MLIETVKKTGADVGFATDGDADRIGAVDRTGEFINSNQIFSTVLQHLVKVKGRKGSMAKTLSASQMLNKQAEAYGLKLYETSVGFKYICDLMLKDPSLIIGGEESGGIGYKDFIPERDGTLMSLFLTEIMITTGKSLLQIYEDLMNEFGKYYYHRVDLRLAPEQKDKALDHLKRESLKKVASFDVDRVQTSDGYKFFLKGGGWVLIRASGTEPILRLYAEAESMDKVRSIISFVEKFSKS